MSQPFLWPIIAVRFTPAQTCEKQTYAAHNLVEQ